MPVDFRGRLKYVSLMASTCDVVKLGACVVADGAWGTEFQRLGLEAGSPPEHWNLLHPEKVAEVARSYVEAGARIILTNTFGGSAFRLARHGLEGSVEEINTVGAEISKKAAGDRAAIFGSMGPTGKLLCAGEVARDEMYESFQRQAVALYRGGVDAILIETMIDVEEMKVAASAARKSTPLPLVLSMTFDSGKDKTRTMMGVTPEQAVAEMEKLDAWIVGANCGVGPESYVEVCRRIRAATSKPIWIKPNAGMPQVTEQGVTYSQTPEMFGSFALQLRDAGATVIGGCCGTTPAHIRRLRELLEQ